MRKEEDSYQCPSEKSPEHSYRYCTPPTSPQECCPTSYKKKPCIRRTHDCDDLHRSPSRDACICESNERGFHESSEVSSDILDSSSEQVAIPVQMCGEYVECINGGPTSSNSNNRCTASSKKCASDCKMENSCLEAGLDSPRECRSSSGAYWPATDNSRICRHSVEPEPEPASDICSCERSCGYIPPEEKEVVTAVASKMDPCGHKKFGVYDGNPLCCKKDRCDFPTSCQPRDGCDSGGYKRHNDSRHGAALGSHGPNINGPLCGNLMTSCGMTIPTNECSPPVQELPPGVSVDLLIQQLACPQYRDVTADLTVKVKGQSFKAHRFILAHHSCYFLTLLKQKSGKIFTDVTLRDISPESFALVLEWMYTNQLILTSSNLLDVMHTAQCLEISEMMSITLEYLNKLVETPECLLVVHLQAVQSDRKCLVEHTLRLLSIVFRHIICCDDFVQIKCEHLHYLITCNNLNVSCEKEAFDAVLRWISHDLDNRKSSAVDLLRCIRFGYMSDQELFECMYSDYTKPIMEIQECRLMVLHGYLYHTSTSMGNTNQFPELMSIPRQSLWEQYNLEQYVQGPDVGPHDLLEFDDQQMFNIGLPGDSDRIDSSATNGYLTCPDIRSMVCPLGKPTPCYKNMAPVPNSGSTIPCFPKPLSVSHPCMNQMAFGCNVNSSPAYGKTCGHLDDGHKKKNAWASRLFSSTKAPRNKDCPGGGIDATLQCKAVLQAECMARQMQARQAGGMGKFDNCWDPDRHHQSSAMVNGRAGSANSLGFSIESFDNGLASPIAPRTAPAYSSHNKQFSANSPTREQHHHHICMPYDQPRQQQQQQRQQRIQLQAGEWPPSKCKNLDGVIQEQWPNKCERMGRMKSCDAKCDADVLPSCRRNPCCPLPEPVLMRIVLLGGLNPLDSWSTDTAGTLAYAYDSPKNKWKKFCQLPAPRHHAAAAAVGGLIYLVGGCCPSHSCNGQKIQALRTAWCLNLPKLQWEKVCDMKHARIHHAAVELNGCIFAIGGQDDCGQILASVEVLGQNRDSWCEVAPLPTPRMGIAAAVFCDAIWVAGGMGNKERDKCPSILKIVEYYCQSTDSWYRVNSLRFPRCFSSLVDYNGALHLVGGVTRVSSRKDGVISSVAAVDVYDREADQWSYKTGLQVPRHSAVALEADGKLYVIGGITSLEGTALDCVECYEDTKNGWHKGVAHLPLPLSGMAGVMANVAC